MLLDAALAEPGSQAVVMAVQALGDIDAARRFLLTPNPYFQNEPPIVVAARSSAGLEQLKGFLDGIRFGLPA